jgi:SOS-response transcriptional repressor LexA
MGQITEKHYQTLQAIESFIAENGLSPTIRELMNFHGLSSPAPVQSRLDALSLAGAISSLPQKARTIKVLIPSSEYEKAGKLYQRQGAIA